MVVVNFRHLCVTLPCRTLEIVLRNRAGVLDSTFNGPVNGTQSFWLEAQHQGLFAMASSVVGAEGKTYNVQSPDLKPGSPEGSTIQEVQVQSKQSFTSPGRAEVSKMYNATARQLTITVVDRYHR